MTLESLFEMVVARSEASVQEHLKCVSVKNAFLNFSWMYFLFEVCGRDIVSLSPAHMPFKPEIGWETTMQLQVA